MVDMTPHDSAWQRGYIQDGLPCGESPSKSRPLDLRSHIPGPLLLRVKGGRVLPQGITSQAILKNLQRLANKTEVDEFSPHDLRRTFITELISRGGDLFSVQRLAGHADVKTTARYDRRGEEAKRKIALLLDV
jgi:integrase/recombinase XerD